MEVTVWIKSAFGQYVENAPYLVDLLKFIIIIIIIIRAESKLRSRKEFVSML